MKNHLIYFNRWVKFEEDVEEGGSWSKPYVATLSLHSLFELRSMLLNGTVCLGINGNSLDEIADGFLDRMVISNQVIGVVHSIVRQQAMYDIRDCY